MWRHMGSVFDDASFSSSQGFYTQISNPRTNHGFVYVHSTFDGAPGVVDNYLSRIARASRDPRKVKRCKRRADQREVRVDLGPFIRRQSY
jgi:hypothetical protein